ncbi:cation:proton antiporter [Thiomicrospira cyclica]|uniref:Na+/H+ antiporter subunit n=1 Tax=Thiomicrospira cyclica (strain DSM 14477 / JCM 11371 / ALM1) TaxID=717773 RepID=F6D8Z5_THICA|nr:monovalent cation/H(+) antiporter subunit G [Thiomicrospira cyclica]AEG31995.1 Na+/H+ antiporter subunit [Thiomicrospira cyclica ALM1]
MIIIEIIAVVSISLGLVFFVAGTLGLLRFTDDLSRLHALTKADNLGLGFVLLGLTLLFFNAALLMKLFIIWALVIISAATVSHAIGQRAYHQLSQPAEVDDDHP